VRTLNSVFTSTVVHRGGMVNKFYVSADRPLAGLATGYELTPGVPASFRSRVAEVMKGATIAETARGQVLLDDYNPVDVLDAKNRQWLHQALTVWFRTE
jgi:hypothetical protein